MERGKSNEQIGQMDKPIRIDRPITVKGKTGQETITWEELVQVWAEKKQAAGKEIINGGKETDFSKVIWRIRYNPDITQKMRVVANNIEYDILDIIETERNRFLELVTESRI